MRQIGIANVDYRLMTEPEIIKPIFVVVTQAPQVNLESNGQGSLVVALYTDSAAAEWIPQLQAPTQKYVDGAMQTDDDGNPIFEQLPQMQQDGVDKDGQPIMRQMFRRRRNPIKGFENVHIQLNGELLQVLQGKRPFPGVNSPAYVLPEGLDHPSDPINWGYWVLSQLTGYKKGVAVLGE